MQSFQQKILLEEALYLHWMKYEGSAKSRLELVARSIEEPNVRIPRLLFKKKKGGR